MKSEAYIHNERQLAEITKTLRGEKTGGGKIGIFLPSGAGDIMTAMSVLIYKDELWKRKDIVWFCNMPNADVFRFNDVIAEIRPYPWEGISVDPYSQLRTEENRLNQKRKHEFEITTDLEDGYFPAPWMIPTEKRGQIEYPNISRQIFGIEDHLTWRPYLCFSEEERTKVTDFIRSFPKRKNILIETGFNSNQSGWDTDLTERTIKICKEYWGECNFFFASLNSNAESFGGIPCNDFTVRQTALIHNLCDLFIGVSSGVSVATSCWSSKWIPKIQFCNSIQCSTRAFTLADGNLTIIYPDELENMMGIEQKLNSLKTRYEDQLIEILKYYK